MLGRVVEEGEQRLPVVDDLGDRLGPLGAVVGDQRPDRLLQTFARSSDTSTTLMNRSDLALGVAHVVRWRMRWMSRSAGGRRRALAAAHRDRRARARPEPAWPSSAVRTRPGTGRRGRS